MKFLGMYRQARTAHAQSLTGEGFVSLGQNALSGEDVRLEGGVLALAAGRMRNREQLARALRLDTRSPQSELVLAAYRMWGADYPRRIEGPLVTAIIDRTEDRLILSRDRIGELPVFYAWRGRSAAFAVHPELLLRAGVAGRVVDRDGLCEIFALGPARSPGRTPFRDIRALEPGCVLLADARGVRVKKYFSLEIAEHEHDFEETARTVRELIESAIDDVRAYSPGVMLSGGLDSTALTAIYSRGGALTVNSYSVDYAENQKYFKDNTFQPEQDAPYVHMASAAYKTAHERIVLSPEALYEALPDATLMRGLPGMADVDSSLLLFARGIGRSSRYVLSGECGDEVFGGYPWFKEGGAEPDAFPWSPNMGLREQILKKEVREALQLRAYAQNRLHEAIDRMPTRAADSREEARLRLLQGLCFQWFMPNLQERAFFMCEGGGVHVITPYSDDRLMSYVYNVPWEMKMHGRREKGLLRAAVADLLPEALLERKKSPYPKTYHPEYTEYVRRAAARMADDSTQPIMRILDADEVKRIASGTLSPTDTPWYGQLMTGPQMLAYLIQVNDWMVQNETETEF